MVICVRQSGSGACGATIVARGSQPEVLGPWHFDDEDCQAARDRTDTGGGLAPDVARRLPVDRIFGRLYFVDARLNEWRAVDNPHDRIPF